AKVKSGIRIHAAALGGALVLALGGCSFTSDALWPSLTGEDPRAGSAAPGQPAPVAEAPISSERSARIEIPPSQAERAASVQPSAQPQQPPVEVAPSSTTAVGQRVARLREDVRRLQASVSGNYQAL